MPRKPVKKKAPHEMTDAELLRQVFPPKVAEAIEHEVEEDPEPDDVSPSNGNDN